MTGRQARAAAPSAVRVPRGAVMLLLSICGMAIGLAIDCGATPPDLIAALCAGASGSPAATVGYHLTVMPAAYAMMVGGSLVAIAFSRSVGARSARPSAAMPLAAAAALMAMTAGMFAGGWLGPDLLARAGIATGFAGLVAGMVAGMAAAIALASPLLRYAEARSARRGRPPQYIMYQ